MENNTLNFCADILSKMDLEVSKRNEIYKHGVDLANYESIYLECLMDALIFILKDESFRSDIEWYLFEYCKDDEERHYFINNEKVSVEDPKDFFKINYDLKKNK
jgi:hypothetical protein